MFVSIIPTNRKSLYSIERTKNSLDNFKHFSLVIAIVYYSIYALIYYPPKRKKKVPKSQFYYAFSLTIPNMALCIWSLHDFLIPSRKQIFLVEALQKIFVQNLVCLQNCSEKVFMFLRAQGFFLLVSGMDKIFFSSF